MLLVVDAGTGGGAAGSDQLSMIGTWQVEKLSVPQLLLRILDALSAVSGGGD